MKLRKPDEMEQSHNFKARIILHFKLKPVSLASKTMQNKKHSKAA